MGLGDMARLCYSSPEILEVLLILSFFSSARIASAARYGGGRRQEGQDRQDLQDLQDLQDWEWDSVIWQGSAIPLLKSWKSC
jgi:hypothetical protein